MKKEIKIAIVIVGICLVVSSIIGGIVVVLNHNKLKKLPVNPIVFESGEIDANGEYTGYKTVEYNDKIYIMYGGIKAKGLLGDIGYAYGDCLGYVDDDKAHRIYELKGESTDEWLIGYYISGLMDQPIILREITTKDNSSIPSSVESFDYEYWK